MDIRKPLGFIVAVILIIPGFITDFQSLKELYPMLGQFKVWNYVFILASLSVLIWTFYPSLTKDPQQEKDKWRLALLEKLNPEQILELEREDKTQRMNYFLFSIFFILSLVAIAFLLI